MSNKLQPEGKLTLPTMRGDAPLISVNILPAPTQGKISFLLGYPAHTLKIHEWDLYPTCSLPFPQHITLLDTDNMMAYEPHCRSVITRGEIELGG